MICRVLVNRTRTLPRCRSAKATRLYSSFRRFDRKSQTAFQLKTRCRQHARLTISPSSLYYTSLPCRQQFFMTKRMYSTSDEFMEPDNISDLEQELESDFSVGERMYESGKYEEALDIFVGVRDRLAKLEHLDGLAGINNWLGLTLTKLKRYDEALACHEVDLKISTATGNDEGQYRALSNIAITYESMGDYAKAEEVFKRAIEAANRVGNNLDVSRAYSGLGAVLMTQKKYQAAVTAFQEEVSYLRETNDHQSLFNAMKRLALAQIECGLHTAALSTYKQLLAEQEMKKASEEDKLETTLAIVNAHIHAGDIETALAYLDELISAAKASDNKVKQVYYLMQAGDIHMNKKNNADAASTLLKEAAAIAKSIPLSQKTLKLKYDAHAMLSHAFEKLNDFSNAISAMNVALECAIDINSTDDQKHSITRLRRLAALRDKAEDEKLGL